MTKDVAGADAGKVETQEIHVGIRELRERLAFYLRQARSGVPVFVTSHRAVVAEIRAPSTQPGRRRPGALRGQIHMAPDFDTLPDEVLDAIES